MGKTKGRPLLSAAIVALFATASVSTAVDPRWLFTRDGVCGGDGTLNQCGQAGLPDNFCCPKDNSCIVLAGQTTVLCCPKGSECATITPITCDITLQDASQHPGAAVKTTVLDGRLPTCKDGCCPFGYSCDNGACRRDQDQSNPPAGASPNPNPSSTQTSEPTTSATTKPSASASATSTPQPSNDDTTESGGTPVGVIVGAVIAAILVVAALIWLVVVLRRKKSNKTDLERKNSSSSSFGNTGNIRGKVIGNPVLAPGAYDAPVNVFPDNKKHSMGSSTLTPQSFHSGRFGLHPQQPFEKRNSYEYARSHHHSAEVGSLRRNLTNRTGSPPRTPEQRNGRQSSEGIADITMCFQSPSTVASTRANTTATAVEKSSQAENLAQGNFLSAGQPPHSSDRGTVWGDLYEHDTPTPPSKGRFQNDRMN